MNNLTAFLDMIGVSEGTKAIPNSDDGYKALVGGKTFDDYKDHPRILVDLGHGLKSTAAGKYQILARFYDAYKKQLFLSDFSPNAQDRIAVKMIDECNAFNDVMNGNIQQAITKCASRWASFPSAGYGQHEQSMEHLVKAFVDCGGVLNEATS